MKILNKALYFILLIVGILLVISFNSFYCLKEKNMKKSDKEDIITINLMNNHYLYDDIIELNCIVDQKYDIINYYFNSNYFSVIESTKIGNTIVLSIQLNLLSERSCFETIIEFDNNSSISCKIYAYMNNNDVFISTLSYGDAKLKYYEYMYDNNMMSISEIRNDINNDILHDIKIEKTENLATQSIETELRTRLLWKDDYNQVHGLAYTKFEITEYNSPNGASTYTYYTDSEGYFPREIYVNSPTNLELKIYAAGENIEVREKTFLWSNPQYVKISDFTADILSYTIEMSTTTDFARSMQVSQALIYAEKYALIVNGTPLSRVVAYYPSNDTAYDTSNKTIKILGEGSDLDYSDWDVIMHEYGHHVASELNIHNSQGGEHGSRTNLSDLYGKSRGIRLAWSEAIATIFSGMSQEYFYDELKTIKYVADGKYSDLYVEDGEFVDRKGYYYDRINTKNGESCERTIIGILWDLYDDDSDGVESHDTSSFGHFEFWQLLKNSGSITLSEFVEYYYSVFSFVEYREKIGKILEYYNISPTDVHLSTRSNDLGYNIPTFQWIANGTSDTLKNNRFLVEIFSEDCIESIRILTTDCYLTLTEEQWNIILNWPCQRIMIMVLGFQDDTPATGPYGQSFTYFTKPQFKISLSGDNISIDGLYYGSTSLEIPAQLNDKQVVSINNGAFRNNSDILFVNIPNTVINIFPNTFENCVNLKEIIMSENTLTIGISAFKGCTNLSDIIIPNSVLNIGDFAFMNCLSLSRIAIYRSIVNITNLGEDVFNNCHNNLQILVPTDRIAEYKNKEHWCAYKSRIMPIRDYSLLEVDCKSNLHNRITLSSAHNKLYKLSVKCSKTYRISVTSIDNVNINIYDANMDIIDNNSNELFIFLSNNTYFISFEFDSINSSGLVELNMSLRWSNTDVQLVEGLNNIKNNLHSTYENTYHGNFYYFNNKGEGFYKFNLNADKDINYPLGSIKIYSDHNRTSILNRYGSAVSNLQAISNYNENEIFIYLSEKKNYYIDIMVPQDRYMTLSLQIEEVDSMDISYHNRLASIGYNDLFYNKNSQSYFEKVSISHRSAIELHIMISGQFNDDIAIYIFERHRDSGYEVGENHYYIDSKLIQEITNSNAYPILSIILDPGTFYIGYSNNKDNANISFELVRNVKTNLNINGTLVTDPAYNNGFALGSEVNFNNGMLLGNTITEGFTRNLYLMIDDNQNQSISRLDYDWYSSDEKVAKVSKYGTVLALNVTKDTAVTIYAVNKNDPSIVYTKDLIVLKETKTEEIVIECNMTYSYSEENGTYLLELDFTNSPYPYINYYSWNIECNDDLSINLGNFGTVFSSGPGYAFIIGNYTLNNRIFVKINLTITE